jgi:hypothetical protein
MKPIDKCCSKIGLVITGACAAVCMFLAPDSFAQRKDQPTANQEASLKEFLQGYTNDKVPSYVAAFVDLRDDGVQQAIVYITGKQTCGTGGCNTLILEPSGQSYRIISDISIVHPPVRILSSKSQGWHDISVVVAGGGIQPGYEAKLSFDGTTYPSNPSVPPAQRLNSGAAGIVVVAGVVIKRPPATKAKPTEVETIVPGQSVGRLPLGVRQSDLERPVFSWKTKPSFVGSTTGTCNQIEVRWWGDQASVVAYLVDDSVYQVDVSPADLFTVQGVQLSHDTNFPELRRMLPKGTLLRWSGSAFLSPAGEDILFWVSAERGIALRLDYDPYDVRTHQLNSRVVQSISVFKAGANFQPDGCLQQGRKLEPVN